MRVYQHLNSNRRNPKWINNWGDSISAELVSKLTGINFESTTNQGESEKLVAIGSVMNTVGRSDLVWGTGCIHQNSIGKKPKKILAVRGPLTHQVLHRHSIEAPKIYGDPALLFPKIYQPVNPIKTHKYGIIPHYIDQDITYLKGIESDKIKIIDICDVNFIDQLHTVEYVISSSLHGLIAADAYGIPNARVIMSTKLLGGNFKFDDYFYSVGRNDEYVKVDRINLDLLQNIKFNDSIKINLDLLLESLLKEIL